MHLLDGKIALILGVANDHSIAWGIARALAAHGATLGFTYPNEVMERRVRPLAQQLGSTFIAPCDVRSDEQIAALMDRARAEYGRIDILIHSIAFANRDELCGAYCNTTREGFLTAMDVSVYSLTALIKASDDLLVPGASVITLTYYGSQKAIPNYNVMGVAKAALEASVRYLAVDVGPRQVRVNAISAGPIRTLAASGISGFRSILTHVERRAPLRRNVTIDDIGNAAVWLCSDLSSAVTGEIIYVDAGYHTTDVLYAES